MGRVGGMEAGREIISGFLTIFADSFRQEDRGAGHLVTLSAR
jgi:hypothetical protein